MSNSSINQDDKDFEPLEFDDLLERVGSKGRYQKLLLYGVICPIHALTAFMGFTQIYILYVPDHWCTPSEGSRILKSWKDDYLPIEPGPDGKDRFSQCEMYDGPPSPFSASVRNTIPCNHGWTFNQSDFKSTIVTEHNWICNQDFYSTYVFTFGSIGQMIGTLLFGRLADKYGRRPMYFIGLSIFLLFSMISYYVPQYFGLFLASTFISLIGWPPLSIPSLIMSELCDNEYRSWASVSGWVSWVIGMAGVPIVAYLTGEWFSFALIVTLPGVLLFLYLAILPESPRWLTSVGRTTEATQVILAVARINANGNGALSSNKFLQEDDLNTKLKFIHQVQNKNSEERSPSIMALFTNPNLAKTTLLLTICWTASEMIYDQITLDTPYMTGNQFVNFFILAIAELPANVIGGYLIGVIGRRWPPVFFFMVCSVACWIAALTDPECTNVIISCILLAKFCITATFLTVFVQSTELFPTVLRGTGTATVSTICSGINLCTPAIVYMRNYYAGAPFLAMALMSIAGCASAMFIPETLGHHLAESIESAEEFGKNQEFWAFYLRSEVAPGSGPGPKTINKRSSVQLLINPLSKKSILQDFDDSQPLLLTEI